MDRHTIEICAGVGMLGEGLRAGLAHMGVTHRTVAYIEREAYAASVLVARMEEGSLDGAPIWPDLLTFDGATWRGAVDCIAAGFPCQDLSLAGKRAGLDGARSGLFFNILDIADACGARFLFLENVAGIASATASVVDEEEGELEERAASRVVGELADRGWHAEWITLSASDVGASHGRARWFCLAWRKLAHATRNDRDGQHGKAGLGRGVCETSYNLAHASDERYSRGASAGREEIGRVEHTNRTLGDPNSPRWAQTGSGSPQHAGQQPESRCGDVAHSEGIGQRPRWSESSGQQRQAHASECSRAMADSSLARLQGSEQRGACTCDRGGPEAHGSISELRGALPLFAPGPSDPRWAGIIAERPWLAPATESNVRMLAHGTSMLVDESRNHQLRQVGNGCVPTQAAIAFIVLARRSGVLT